jgi:hypothetical protein
MEADALKEQVIEALERLPGDRLQEVQDFVQYLLRREDTATEMNMLERKTDPIRQLIGAADEEPFAEAVDEDLYGS